MRDPYSSISIIFEFPHKMHSFAIKINNSARTHLEFNQDLQNHLTVIICEVFSKFE